MNRESLQFGFERGVVYPRPSGYHEAPSPNRLGVFVCRPASRHEWQTQPGSKRGLAFTSEAKSAQNRARIAVESRKSSGGATSGTSEAIAGGSRPENLGIATPPWRTRGRTGKNPVNDLPLSNRSCPSDRCAGFER
jgi:hypothetical protein